MSEIANSLHANYSTAAMTDCQDVHRQLLPEMMQTLSEMTGNPIGNVSEIKRAPPEMYAASFLTMLCFALPFLQKQPFSPQKSR